MGNDSSKRTPKPFVGTTILRVGIDDVAQAQADQAAPPAKVISTLSTGQELTRANVCEIFEQLLLERSKTDEPAGSAGKGKMKKKEKGKLKLDYERSLRYLCDDLVFILKDKELRDGLLELSPEAFEQLMKSDDLVVPDESIVLLALGAWAERRAYKDEMEKNPPPAGAGLLHPPPSNNVDLRGSDSLFKSLGEGAAKLLVPSPSSSSSSDQESTTATTATTEESKGKKEEGKDGEEAGGGEEVKKPVTAPAGDDDGGDKDGGADPEPKEAQEDAPAKTLSKSQEELQVNLRGTAGLYATFAGAYVNMISDEEMARKLQDEELEDDKVRRKMMEEEDEKLARALQEGEIADGGALPTGSSLSVKEEEEEEEDLEPIPDYKLTPEYIDRIKKYMLPFIPYIRFSMLPLNILNTLANEHLVPTQYLTEAFKYHALVSADLMNLLDNKNPRYKRRKYICSVQWDRQWHGQNVQVSSDGKVATKTQASWYAIACASEGFTQGKHFWAIKVDGDEAYIGVTQKGNTSMDNYLGGNAQSWGFRTSYKYSTSHGNGHYGETFGRGDVIGVLLDMDTGGLTYFKNGKNLGVCFTGLPRTEKLYPAVGWRAGYMTLVDINPSQYPDNFVVGLLS